MVLCRLLEVRVSSTNSSMTGCFPHGEANPDVVWWYAEEGTHDAI